MTHRLTLKAPHRHWRQDENGLWYSEPWTKQTMAECQQGGGWFSRFPADHDIRKEAEPK